MKAFYQALVLLLGSIFMCILVIKIHDILPFVIIFPLLLLSIAGTIAGCVKLGTLKSNVLRKPLVDLIDWVCNEDE